MPERRFHVLSVLEVMHNGVHDDLVRRNGAGVRSTVVVERHVRFKIFNRSSIFIITHRFTCFFSDGKKEDPVCALPLSAKTPMITRGERDQDGIFGRTHELFGRHWTDATKFHSLGSTF